MIKIENLTFGYKRKGLLFDDLSMQLLPGRIYGLFGKNGAGKTTLLKHMAGLLFPKKGKCFVFDQHASDRKPGVLADIFVIPEEFDLPDVSIQNFITINSPFFPKFDKEQMTKYMSEFKINDESRLTSMSYGQKKKFIIAFGLSANTRLMLMDEPTNGLDIPSKSQFRKIIASSANEDRTILVSTHQVRDLATIIDQVTILDEGTIIFDQSIEDISKKFAFGKIKDDEMEHVVYAEDVLGGKAAICLNKRKDSEVDMELLFNAIINDPEKINSNLKPL